ncbi:MAG: hypothetical protein ACUVXF_11905, partial [Desulfobaccales bacterium]
SPETISLKPKNAELTGLKFFEKSLFRENVIPSPGKNLIFEAVAKSFWERGVPTGWKPVLSGAAAPCHLSQTLSPSSIDFLTNQGVSLNLTALWGVGRGVLGEGGGPPTPLKKGNMFFIL